VPQDWLDTVRQTTEDTVLDIAAHLPDQAQKAVLAAAVGEAPTARIAERIEGSGYAHPDALRRFRVVGDKAELVAALDAPWDEWADFLHPAQQEFVERDFNGPARIIGSAGTGKTVVALHRAVRLAAEAPETRVLLTTFSPELAQTRAQARAADQGSARARDADHRQHSRRRCSRAGSRASRPGATAPSRRSASCSQTGIVSARAGSSGTTVSLIAILLYDSDRAADREDWPHQAGTKQITAARPGAMPPARHERSDQSFLTFSSKCRHAGDRSSTTTEMRSRMATGRGGSVGLNRGLVVAEWMPALVMLRPGGAFGLRPPPTPGPNHSMR
jgi:UvrD/REP helicase N-terminal domain